MPFGQDRPVQHRSVPVNFIEDAAKDERHPAASKRGLAIAAMKPFAGGMIDNADIAFKFLRQYPDVLPQALPNAMRIGRPASIFRLTGVPFPNSIPPSKPFKARVARHF